MKLAQALPETSSLILSGKPHSSRDIGYDIELTDRGFFHITQVTGKNAGREFLVFPANVAYAVPEAVEKKKPGRPKLDA